jgi:ATP-dependent DNA helicase DinG
MGRENYICPKKLFSAFIRLSGSEPVAALSLALGAAFSAEGLAETMPAASRRTDGSITAPPRCGMKACDHADRCYLLKARRKAAGSSIVFVNHALLLSDYQQGGAVLGPYSRVIVDEAHHLENCIVENLSVRISRNDFDGIFDLISPVSMRSDRWKHLIGELEERGASRNWRDIVSRISDSVASLRALHRRIFSEIIIPEGISDWGTVNKTRYRGGLERFGTGCVHINEYCNTIYDLRTLLKLINEVTVGRNAQLLQNELKYIDEGLLEICEKWNYLSDADDPDSVFWIEWDGEGRALVINGSPLDVSRRFADILEEKILTAVFTSATLAQEGRFDQVASRLGIGLTGREPVTLVAPSPFDYAGNLRILLRSGLGDPNDDSYAGAVADMIAHLAESTSKRIMVLLTSYRMCRSTSVLLGSFDLPGPVFVQGKLESREELAARFRKTPHAVLLGVASFWEGIDFPGDELEILVIPKVPFPVPTEPLMEARSERLVELGENPFIKLALPEAILKLRQGIGRLIRRKGDRGVVVLMDSRLGSRSYAETILDSLPARITPVGSSGEAAKLAGEWLGGSGP